MSSLEKQVSCIVPARNEAGHLQHVIKEILQIPEIGEIIIVEGGSSDDTWSVAKKLSRDNPMFIKVIRQDGKGKMNAVYRGMEISSGSLILIWDADGTVPADDVARMIDLSVEEQVFVKGDRLRGEMSHGAMQPINFLGNWFFALVWSPVLREKPSDVLCGSKIFPRRVFEVLDEDLLKRDPYGDFALLYAANLSKCKVRSIEVKYLARSYGVTNISRWSGALHLLSFVLWMYRKKYFAWARIRRLAT